MPTLEDVFLNVAQEDTKLENKKMSKQHRKFSSPMKIMIEYYLKPISGRIILKNQNLLMILKLVFIEGFY